MGAALAGDFLSKPFGVSSWPGRWGRNSGGLLCSPQRLMGRGSWPWLVLPRYEETAARQPHRNCRALRQSNRRVRPRTPRWRSLSTEGADLRSARGASRSIPARTQFRVIANAPPRSISCSRPMTAPTNIGDRGEDLNFLRLCCDRDLTIKAGSTSTSRDSTRPSSRTTRPPLPPALQEPDRRRSGEFGRAGSHPRAERWRGVVGCAAGLQDTELTAASLPVPKTR